MYTRSIDFERMSSREIKEEFDKYNGIIPTSLVEKYTKGISYSTDSGRKIFAKNLNILYARAMMHVSRTDAPFLPLPKIRDGDLTIGKYKQGTLEFGECKIKLNDLIQTSIIAAPNKGKTRLIFTLIKEILKLNDRSDTKTSVVMLDKKQDGRNIGPEPVVLSAEESGINIWDPPPGCDPKRWISDICQLLMSVWQYYQRSRNSLMKVVYNLYESKQKPPTMIEVYEALREEEMNNRRMSNRKFEVNEVNQDRIENALQEFGACFSTRKTFPLYEFLDSAIPLVIEADVSNDSFALLLGWLLLYIYRYRKSNNLRGNLSEGGTVVVCDEAYLLWEMARDYSETRRELGGDFISTSPMYIRDFRCAILAASQRPLSSDFMSTTNLKVVGFCGDYEDAKFLASSLGDPSLTEIISKLEPRHFIIKIGDMPPALLKTEDCPLQPVNDADLKERMKPFVDYIKEFRKEDEEEKSEEKTTRVRLSNDAKRLLIDVLAYPESTISSRYFRLALKGKKAQDVVEEVVTSKYADMVVEQIEGSKAAKYLVLTQQAIEWLKSENMDVKHVQHIGKVSPTHALYQNILQVYLRRYGWEVQHDSPVGNKFVDVVATRSNYTISYEIAVTGAVDKERVLSALPSVSEYIFLCRDMIILSTIRSQLEGIKDGKIKYYVASQYMTNLKKGVLANYHYKTENTQNKENKQNLTSSESEQEENRST